MAQVGHGSIIITDLTDTLNTQHFWWTAEGEETPELPGGAYITDTPIKDFRTNPVGGNLLTRSNGLWLRNGVDLLVSLTSEGLVFYTPDQKAAAEIDISGLNILDGAITFQGDFNEVVNPSNTNPSEYYWYEAEITYIPFAVPEEGNPYELELYELISGQYVLTEDTSVIDGKTYYKKNIEYILTIDETVTPGKTYYRASKGCINLSDYGFNREINGVLREDLAFAIGDNFAVNAAGILYANGATLSGEVTIDDTLIISTAAANSILDSTTLPDDLENINNSIISLQSQVFEGQGKILGSMTFGVEEEYIPFDVPEGGNPQALELYELVDDEFVLTGDTSAEEGKTYYKLQTNPALQIKASEDSNSSVKITNTELQFLEGDNKVASVSNQTLEITDAVILNKLQFGSFAFIPRENGNLSLKYIGE